MREDEGASWFSRWEDQLPSPGELMPLSQSLITPDLALAFDIPTPNNSNPTPSSLPPSSTSPRHDHHHHHDSSNGADGGSGEEPARTLKRPRLVWTPQLHKRFVDAVAHLGIKNAVPKTIMQLMGVDGLTRENVASHLQKYRLYLKRMQGGGGGGANGGASPSSGGGPGIGHISAADHQLFASAPVPHHFLLGRGGPPPEPPFTHSAAAAASMQQLYNHHHQQFFHQRHIAQFGSPPANGFSGGFMMQRMMSNGGSGIGHSVAALSTFPEDMESEAGRERDRRVLTLFPTGDD